MYTLYSLCYAIQVVCASQQYKMCWWYCYCVVVSILFVVIVVLGFFGGAGNVCDVGDVQVNRIRCAPVLVSV